MKFIELDQRTDAWKEWRRQGVTATDSPVILKRNPRKTPWRLWAEKVGKVLPADLSKNPYVRYGVEHEDDARRLFELKHGVCAPPACGEWDEDPVFRASFDGLTPDFEPLEIKCPSASTLEDVRTRGVDSDAVRMYVVQLQHQMLVADAKRGWLVFYDGPNDDLVEFEFERDEELVGQIVNEGRAFHALVETKTEPPKDPDEDVFIPETDEDRECWVRAALDFLSIDADIRRHQEEIRLLQERREAAQVTFKRIMGDNACAEYAGVAVTRSVVKGRVNAEKLFEAALSRRPTEAELAACRSPDTERWLFRATGRDVPKDFADEQLARETAELREETTGSFYF